ncbi:hypothetical protein [Pseudomonas chlororaphis]|uniref:hypothetical protein n=1 Tax=Pseudomonas chlororaphis TaxID=587753 RepID=UPI0024079020|nr:hypothetical protein [Pseudomonas chlororaphis]
MLDRKLEMQVRDIPIIYEKFSALIGENVWKRRALEIKSAIKGNRYSEFYLTSENEVALAFNRLREVISKYGALPISMLEPGDYPILAFADSVLLMVESCDKEMGRRLVQRVRGSFKNPADLRALRLELFIAAHCAHKGYEVVWPEMTDIGTFDILVPGVGSNGLEIECKSISEDKGRKVHGWDAIDFLNCLGKKLNIESSVPVNGIGLAVTVTVPDRLPSTSRLKVELAQEVLKAVGNRGNLKLSDGTNIKIVEFDSSIFSGFNAQTDNQMVMTALEEMLGIRVSYGVVRRSAEGGVLAIVVNSAIEDAVIEYVLDVFSKSAKKQLSRTRPGLLVAGFDGLDNKQLASIAVHDYGNVESPTTMKTGALGFLRNENRDHVIGTAFVCRPESISVEPSVTRSTGSAYHFYNRESSMWHNDMNDFFR